MIKDILNLLNPKSLKGKTLVVSNEKLERRVVLLEDNLIESYDIEREGEFNISGSIYKGVVKNIEFGLKAMFVDIGLEKNAFLHFWDALLLPLDSEFENVNRQRQKKNQKPRITAKDIPNIYPINSTILVQVSKGMIGTKGARVSTNISIPGRYLVLTPYAEQFGISKKIENPQERARIRKILQKLSLPEGMGIIVRTVAEGQRVRHFVRDLSMLLNQWEKIELKSKESAPNCVYKEPDLLEKVAHQFLTNKIDRVLCNDADSVQELKSLIGEISKLSKRKVHHLLTKQPIFESLGIEKQIQDTFQRQVWLPCGGYLVIDETEAMIAIDVNTGRNRGSKGNRVILDTNLEAATEIARQLKLRNIGGLVVIDFIDMRQRRDQNIVYRAMRQHLKKDQAKTQVLEISTLGLMQMTRQRLHESLSHIIYESCPYCLGNARVKSTLTMSIEIQRRLQTLVNNQKQNQGMKNLIIIIHPEVLERLKTHDNELFSELERQYTGQLVFRSDTSLHRDKFIILDEETKKEVTS